MLIGGAVGGKGGGVCCYVWQMTLRNRDRGLITGPIFALGLSCRCFRLPVSFLTRGLLHDMNGPIFANFDTVDSDSSSVGALVWTRHFAGTDGCKCAGISGTYRGMYRRDRYLCVSARGSRPVLHLSLKKKRLKAVRNYRFLPSDVVCVRGGCTPSCSSQLYCRKQDLARWSSDQPRSRSASRSSPQWVL